MDPARPVSWHCERAAPQPAPSSFPRGRQLALLARCGAAIDTVLRSLLTPVVAFRDTPAGSTSLLRLFASKCRPRSGGVPRESLDAPENRPKQARRQVAFGKLEDEVSRMPDEAPPVLKRAVAGGSSATNSGW
jgi:hypothetical protein